jgi:hypothetical protein
LGWRAEIAAADARARDRHEPAAKHAALAPYRSALPARFDTRPDRERNSTVAIRETTRASRGIAPVRDLFYDPKGIELEVAPRESSS